MTHCECLRKILAPFLKHIETNDKSRYYSGFLKMSRANLNLDSDFLARIGYPWSQFYLNTEIRITPKTTERAPMAILSVIFFCVFKKDSA